MVDAKASKLKRLRTEADEARIKPAALYLPINGVEVVAEDAAHS